MKNLLDYIQEKQTSLFKETGVIFAFSQKQFEEQRKEGVVYVNLGMGCLVPKENMEDFKTRHAQLIEDGIAQDLQENGKEAIIIRELENFECFYTGDVSNDVIEYLDGYQITKEEIFNVFNSKRL